MFGTNRKSASCSHLSHTGLDFGIFPIFPSGLSPITSWNHMCVHLTNVLGRRDKKKAEREQAQGTPKALDVQYC